MRPCLAWTLAAAALLVTVPAGPVAAGPNAQPAIATQGRVAQVAVAATGLILAVTDDPGSSLPTPDNPGPDVPTWYIWDEHGGAVHSGSSDMEACNTRLLDVCQSPATSGALSDNGAVFAVGSSVALSADQTRGLLQVGRSADGTTARAIFAAPLTHVALDADGNTVAAVANATPLAPNSAPAFTVQMLSYSGGALASLWSPYTVHAKVSAIALSGDGQRLAVAADQIYLFTRTSGTPTTVSAVAGPASSVALAPLPPHRLLAGYASGTVALLDDAGGAIPKATLSLGGAAVAGVALNGTLGLAADAAGKLHTLRLDAPIARTATLSASADAARQVALSGDGRMVLYRSQSEVALLQQENGTLVPLWTDTPAEPPGSAGIDAAGNVVAVGQGMAVVPYLGVHDLRADPVQPLEVQPDASRTLDITYRNLGNRIEDAELGLWWPGGLFATVQNATFRLAPGQSIATSLHVVVDKALGPGTLTVFLNHTTASGLEGSLAVPIRVLERDAVALDEAGVTNLAIQKGETVHFAAEVSNHGNAPVALSIAAATDPGWRASVTPTSVHLDPGEAHTLDVALTAPDSVKDGDHGTARVSLVGRPGQELDFVAIVGGRLQPAIEVFGLASVKAGQVAEIPLAVRNAGNVADAFDVAVGGFLPDGWTVSLGASGHQALRTGELDAGLSAPVGLRIAVPEKSEGMRVSLTVVATSVGDPAQAVSKIVVLQVAAGQGDGGHPTPGPSPAFALAALLLTALAAMWGRGRRGCPSTI